MADMANAKRCLWCQTLSLQPVLDKYGFLPEGNLSEGRHWMSLTQKILKGSVLNVIDHAVKVGVMLLITPYMVKTLGLERYGIWLVLTAAVAFLGLLDGGITLSGTRYLARALGGKGQVPEVIATLRWLYRWMGVACLVCTGVLVGSVSWLVSDPDWQTAGRWVMGALGVCTAVRFFLRVHLVVLKAHLRYDLIVVSSLVKTVLQSVLIVWLLSQGHGLVVLAFVQVLSDLADQLLLVLFSKKTDKAAPADVGVSKALLPDLLRYSATSFLNTLGQHMRSRLDPFILTTYVGVTAVPVYGMAARLITLFDDLVNAALGGTLLAGFSQVEGSQGLEGLKAKFLYSLKFSVVTAVLGGTGLFCLGPAFLIAWLGPDFAESGKLLQWLCLPAVWKLMQYPGYSLLYSTGKHLWLTKLTFIAGLVNAILSVVLASKYGLYGVVWATFAEMTVFYLILMPRYISSVIGLPVRSYFMELARPALWLAAPMAGWYALVSQLGLLRPHFAFLALDAAGLVFVWALAVVFWVLARDERIRFLKLIPGLRKPSASA